jgi:DNA polymerase III subunit delta
MAKLNTKALFEHIHKGPLAPVYLFTGEEAYFMERALGRITEKALAGAPRDFNLDVFYGKDTKAGEVAAQASVLPMMADKRVVILKEADRLRDLGPITAYLGRPSPDTVLILIAMDADRGKERTLSEAIPGSGVTVHFYHPFESELPGLIRTVARESGYSIDEGAASYLKDVLGGNLALIEAELRKVFNLLGNRKAVTYEDVKESVGDFGAPLVFDMIDAVAGKRPGEAVFVLEKLLRDGEQPLMILGMMAGHYRKLLAAKEGGPEKQPRAFGNAAKIPAQAARLTGDELINAFHLFHKADVDLKSSSLQPGMVMERLVLELSGAGLAGTGSTRSGSAGSKGAKGVYLNPLGSR